VDGSGRREEKENLALTGTRIPIPRPSSQYPVALLTALSQLL
jgi:hypothetical protein